MEKPFGHMLTSLDGKIDGPCMGDPACASSQEKYGEIRGFYGCSATLYGTITMLGSYSAGRAPDTLPDGPACPMEDYVAESDVQNYIVSVDPVGVLGWESPSPSSSRAPITAAICPSIPRRALKKAGR